MVLILLIHLFSLFTLPSNGSSPLIEKYADEISSSISQLENMDTPYFEKVDFKEGELYRFKDLNQQEYLLLISEVAACKLGGCAAFQNANDQLNSEYFDLLIILDPASKIKDIKILDYFSDYGYEITSKRYLDKFKGQTACTFYVEEDGIDAISGATISSYALEGMIAHLCSTRE